MRPDLVRGDVLIAVPHWGVTIDGNFAGKRLDDAQDRLAHLGVTASSHRRSVNRTHQPVAFLTHDDLALTRRAWLRFIAKVDPKRRQENEDKNEGHHHVVGNAAARIGPPEVALEGLAEGSR